MNKIRIRQNYENYERVQNAFKDFIHALVWESLDIDEGIEEDEVNEHIKRYCRNNGGQMISFINDSVTKFIKSLESRYEVHCYEIDEEGNAIEETGKHINTDNLKLALKKVAKFYRSAKRPRVIIYDNETDKYIAEWD